MSAGMKSMSSEEEGLTIKFRPKILTNLQKQNVRCGEVLDGKTSQVVSSPRLCKNKASSISYNYKPRAIQVAGFGSVEPPQKILDYRRDEYLVEKYKFLKFPSPQPNSILFHSVQGDLLRKRQCLPNEAESESIAESVEIIDADDTIRVSEREIQISGRSESVVDLSAYLGSSLEPGYEIQGLTGLWRYLFKKQPLFWKLDEDVNNCHKCCAAFGFITRRHHCRGCGEIFCNYCSRFKAPFSRDGHAVLNGHKERVCEQCLVSTWHL